MTDRLEWKKGLPFPLGVSKQKNGIQFAVPVPWADQVVLHLYEEGKNRKIQSLSLDHSYQWGDIFSVIIENISWEHTEYIWEAEGREFTDPYGTWLKGREIWGRRIQRTPVRNGIRFLEYDWESDAHPNIPLKEAILYQLHVRGFTRHASSGVEHRGTFRGILEKIPYLKELGATSLLVLPCYEFDEILPEDEFSGTRQDFDPFSPPEEKKQESHRINYWGYGKGASYFSPKNTYASNRENPSGELKDLIKELHKNGMEFIMDICFEPGINKNLILDCLRYWVLEYHVDGFKFNENVVPAAMAAADPVLGKRKLFCSFWDRNELSVNGYCSKEKRLADFNDEFLITARRFLKSDEHQVDDFSRRMKKNPWDIGVVNYITNINGFTLMDLVSYDIKHNEANGEQGKDGTDYNYSWNCGVEGKTQRKAVKNLRRKQIRNALVMLFFSQGTPMILSGDEFGNSSGGNNNPYCQDNGTSWLNWAQWKTNQDIYQFMSCLIKLRKSHEILHMGKEFRIMDTISCGYPDISYHGTKAWYPDFSNYSRVLGIMLCGKYVKTHQGREDDFFYLAYNMHWEPHEYGLPSLPTGLEWEMLLDTSEIVRESMPEEPEKKHYLVPARSIVVFISKKVPEIEKSLKKQRLLPERRKLKEP